METQLKYLRSNGERYRREFGWASGCPYGLSLTIQAIKQLRTDTQCSLVAAKDAIEAWKMEGCPCEPIGTETRHDGQMTVGEAKILLKNLLARGVVGLTVLERDAVRRMAE